MADLSHNAPERNVYLDLVSLPEALKRITGRFDRASAIKREVVPSQEAAGRVAAHPVYALYSSPAFHCAAMDGLAVMAERTFAAREGKPLTLRKGTDVRPVNTGQPLPEGADAVIMVEQVVRESATEVEIEKPVFPWQHVRRLGEDIVATELLFAQHHRFSPYDIGALLSAGIWEVEVLERIRIHFIPTGSEVQDFTLRPMPGTGQVIESNSQVLAAMAREWGCDATRFAPVPDDMDALSKATERSLAEKPHFLVLGAGSSAGSRDWTKATLERFGEVLVHGVAVMPGKPSLFGLSSDGGTILCGAPGYPVSSVVFYEELLLPLVRWLEHGRAASRVRTQAVLSRAMPSRPGMEERVRVAMGTVGERVVATPLARGAGLITSLTRAQGVVRVPANSEGYDKGREVEAELLVDRGELERTVVVVGSHDNILDLLANEAMLLDEPLRLASSHVGSLGGLTALRDGMTLLAGAHLFDPQRDDFNFSFLEQYCPGVDVGVVNLAIRHQGLIVAPGNPLAIGSIADLVRPEVRFVNRQRGAGTRILLDHHLSLAGISPDQVGGYGKEEFTHMAVAVNVKAGVADCGMGIKAAAKALGLDFVPLARERYDLLFDAGRHDPRVEKILSLLNRPDLHTRIRDLGGYDTDLTGRRMRPGQGLSS